jgi:hypothetical protein
MNEKSKNPQKFIRLDYNNLADNRIQLIFKKYLKETGNYPNFGAKFKKDFIKWVRLYENRNQDFKILPKLEEISRNKEIYKYIIHLINYTNYSQISISNLLKEKGLYLHPKTIGKISREIVFKNNIEAHKERLFHIYNYHPKIRLDYFKKIDTREKAYWLGYIYADGGLSYKTSKKQYIRFFFGQSVIDEDKKVMVFKLADTLGVERKYVQPDSRGNILQITITNNTLALNLKKYGVIIGKRKSKNIELPELGCRELNLAFLLGYYDGDGTEGSTVITSGSKKFLEQIKEKYDIKQEMRPKKSCSVLNGRELKGEAWDLALGAVLLNETMRNYPYSMARKRKIFETAEEKSERMRQACINRAKLKITDDFLENLKKMVWEIPLYKIAEKYNIAASRISEICQQYQIDKPPIGYWRKKQ